MHREWLSRAAGAIGMLLGVAALAYGARELLTTAHWQDLVMVIAGVWITWSAWQALFPSDFPPFPVDPNDPMLIEAKQRAHRDISRLHAGLAEGRREALIKYPLRMQDGDVEHVWGVLHSIEGDLANVTLVSETVGDVGDIEPRMRIGVAEIEDWALADSQGAMEGGFSHYAMAKLYKREQGYLPYALRKQLARFKDFSVADI